MLPEPSLHLGDHFPLPFLVVSDDLLRTAGTRVKLPIRTKRLPKAFM